MKKIRCVCVLALVVLNVSACTFVKVGLSHNEKNAIQNPPAEIVEYVNQHMSEVMDFLVVHESKFQKSEKRKLSECMQNRAKLLNVINPQDVRVIITKDMPIPAKGDSVYDFYDKLFGEDGGVIGAITIGETVYMRPCFSRSYETMLHELVHVGQYQKYGMKDYLRKYFIDSLLVIYPRIPFETEAFVKVANFSQTNLQSCKKLLL